MASDSKISLKIITRYTLLKVFKFFMSVLYRIDIGSIPHKTSLFRIYLSIIYLAILLHKDY